MTRAMVLTFALLLTLAGAALALGLQSSTGLDTFVSGSSSDYQATQLDARQFGSDAVVVMVHLPVSQLLEHKQLTTVSELEACLAGERLAKDASLGSLQPLPRAHASPYGGAGSPCAELMRVRPARVVYGPGTFLNHAVAAVSQQILTLSAGAAGKVKAAERAARTIAAADGLGTAEQELAAKAAGELALRQQIGSLGTVADELALQGSPSISDEAFLNQIVYGTAGAAAGEPSARFSYLFPTSDVSLIQVRLRSDLSDAQQTRAIRQIEAAVRMPRFRLPGGGYTVTGEPVLLSQVASGIADQLLLLLIGAVAVMGLVLLAIFRRRPRLLPVMIALAATAVTFGIARLVGFSLTIASVAVLPVLIGLAVDYAVQLQSGSARRAVTTAGLATAAGFLALLISPVPMVRDFGVLLIVGVLVALFFARLLVPQLSARQTPAPGGLLTRIAIPQVLSDAYWGAVDIIAGVRRRLPAPPSPAKALDWIVRRPFTVLAVSFLLAAGGWVLDAQTPVQSDITKLVPPGTPALLHLLALEHATGVSGEIDVIVHGHDVATPQALHWMIDYQDAVTRHFGYSSSKSCRQARICPAFSLPSLFTTNTNPKSDGEGKDAKPNTDGSSGYLTQASIDALLKTVPEYFKEAVLTPNRRFATLSFGIRLMPLTEERRVIAYMRSKLAPPAGLTAALSGSPVLAADADADLSSWPRRLLTLALGLVLVALMLLALLRRPRRALVPLVPIVLASGWSALITYLLGIPLNPLSATLGVLVVAISTEFSVLLAERVRVVRRPLRDAVGVAYRSTGLAVMTSAATVIAGFGVLILSNITMISDFGVVTLVDMSVSVLGVLAILPASIAADAKLAAGRERVKR